MAFGAMDARTGEVSNVIALNAPQHRQSLEQRLAAHAALFATRRRGEGDVFWLKENAEFLNILECVGGPVDRVLEVYESVHRSIGARLGEFPQYYRFHLSICLDLEDLGMPGETGAALCCWVAGQGLVKAELSDLQRAEARRLLARRGVSFGDDGLTQRLHRFVGRSRTFALPNRKAAYELTHVVFYLTDYGRRDVRFEPAVVRSLCYTGLLAYLDQDLDLLAEVCIALRFAGQTPSRIWEDAVMEGLRTVQQARDETGASDDYHTYLVSTWLAGLKGRPVLPLALVPGSTRIDMVRCLAPPLRQMSRSLRDLRNPDWHAVRGRVVSGMDDSALRILEAAERSTAHFDSFYAAFARADAPRT